MERKVAVILSGCGYLDGSEITEAVSTLIALSEEGAIYNCYSIDQEVVEVNHITQDETSVSRNILAESARISRSKIKDISKLDESNYDAIVFPGGYGAAKNLCDFAQNGAKGKVHPMLKDLIKKFHQSSKPIGAFCIAPALIALVLGEEGVALTIGNDKDTVEEIKKTGVDHIECAVDDYVTDRENKLITSPAYMYDAKAHEVFKGIRGAIRELIEMA